MEKNRAVLYLRLSKEDVECCIEVLEKEVVGNWISVDYMLPENAERYKGRKVIDVLVTTEKGLVTKVQRQCYRGSWSWGRIFSRVVAWMPLPKPYKEGEAVENKEDH